jgi:hypothetical protein
MYWPRAHEKTFTNGGDAPGKKTPPHCVVNFRGKFWFFELAVYTTALLQLVAGGRLTALTGLKNPLKAS